MATSKPYVMTYLNSRIYQCLVEFKQENELRSLSFAVELILGQYFGVVMRLPTHGSSQELSQSEQIAAMTSCLTQCSHSLHESVDQLRTISNSIQNTTASTFGETKQSTAVNSSQNSENPACELTTPNALTSNILTQFSNYTIRRGITGSALAKRLNTWSSEISRRRIKPGFGNWSRSLDPDQISWEYRGATRRFHPV